MSQVLWERGFIKEGEKYTVNVEKDEFGVKNYNASMKYLLGNCTNFHDEDSLLQSMGKKMGVIIDRRPKCHAELAGEGIEYTWGFAKNYYRRQPLESKRKKETFRALVRSCFSQDKCTIETIRKFSKRARDYIVAYHLLTNKKDDVKHCAVKSENDDDRVVVKVERMRKEFKTHRCAMDFDTKFIESVVECKTIDLTGSG